VVGGAAGVGGGRGFCRRLTCAIQLPARFMNNGHGHFSNGDLPKRRFWFGRRRSRNSPEPWPESRGSAMSPHPAPKERPPPKAPPPQAPTRA
jgi:hypothetical protein